MAEKRLVLPGEELGTTEEFLPGKGTYEEGGKIYSAVAGVLDIDTKEMAILVRPANPPVKLKVGDPVNPDVHMGPMTGKAQFDKQLEFIEIAHVERLQLGLYRHVAPAPAR